MAYAEYTVRLDAFEGPLDLLLFLIRRAEVEVSDIPIASITDQYLKHIEQLGLGSAGEGGAAGGGPGRMEGRLDIERAGEFLVMAATLMEIKSRMLAPIVPADVEGSEAKVEGTAAKRSKDVDPRAELVGQLLEYKRFRDASSQLEQYREQWHARYPSGRALAPKGEGTDDPEAEADAAAAPVEMDDLTLVDLVESFAKIIEAVDFTRVGEHRVLMDDTPVEVHAEAIIERLRSLQNTEEPGRLLGGTSGELAFADLFEGRTRAEMIGLFLALLELVKQQRIALRQEEQDATGRRIVVRLAEESAAAPDQSSSA